MKNLLLLLLLPVLLLLNACNDSTPADPGTGGLGGGIGGGGLGGGGGTGNITMNVVLDRPDQQNPNDIYFKFTPSGNIVVNSLRSVCQDAQFDQTYPVNNGEVYNNTKPFYWGPIDGLQAGQKWQFTVTGKLGSATGQNFTATANITLQ